MLPDSGALGQKRRRLCEPGWASLTSGLPRESGVYSTQRSQQSWELLPSPQTTRAAKVTRTPCPRGADLGSPLSPACDLCPEKEGRRKTWDSCPWNCALPWIRLLAGLRPVPYLTLLQQSLFCQQASQMVLGTRASPPPPVWQVPVESTQHTSPTPAQKDILEESLVLGFSPWLLWHFLGSAHKGSVGMLACGCSGTHLVLPDRPTAFSSVP